MKSNYDLTLTPEETAFAIENQYLINKYLRIRGLKIEDWYDVVVFRYMRSVKRWFAIPELHKYKFQTIVFNAMRSAVGNEYKKQGRRPRTISLFEAIPGTDDLTYMDTLTDPKDQVEELIFA